MNLALYYTLNFNNSLLLYRVARANYSILYSYCHLAHSQTAVIGQKINTPQHIKFQPGRPGWPSWPRAGLSWLIAGAEIQQHAFLAEEFRRHKMLRKLFIGKIQCF